MEQAHLEKLAEKYNLTVPEIRRVVASQFERILVAIQDKQSVRIPHIGIFSYNQKAYDNKQKYNALNKEES